MNDLGRARFAASRKAAVEDDFFNRQPRGHTLLATFQQTIWRKACSSSHWESLCKGNLLMMHGHDKNWVKCLELAQGFPSSGARAGSSNQPRFRWSPWYQRAPDSRVPPGIQDAFCLFPIVSDWRLLNQNEHLVTAAISAAVYIRYLSWTRHVLPAATSHDIASSLVSFLLRNGCI